MVDDYKGTSFEYSKAATHWDLQHLQQHASYLCKKDQIPGWTLKWRAKPTPIPRANVWGTERQLSLRVYSLRS